jgi:hypothetical protein
MTQRAQFHTTMGEAAASEQELSSSWLTIRRKMVEAVQDLAKGETNEE